MKLLLRAALIATALIAGASGLLVIWELSRPYILTTPPEPEPAPVEPAPAPVQPEKPPPAPIAQPSGPSWSSMRPMQLEAFYRGPLMDTVIQRLRDPVDGSICYLYLPIEAQHSPRGSTGYVVYGANSIGSLSCFPGPPMPGMPPPPTAQHPAAPRQPAGPAAAPARAPLPRPAPPE